MTNIAAAIGLAQLEQVDSFVGRKIEIADMYKKLLEGLPIKVQESVGDVKHTYWMVSITCNQIEDRDKLRDFLRNEGVETRPAFYPIHTMPMYSERYQRLLVAEKLSWSGMNLPSYPGLKDKEIKYVCDKIKKYFAIK